MRLWRYGNHTNTNVIQLIMAGQLKIWFSETGDYENLDEGVLDNNAFSLAIPCTNDFRWIEALDDLLVGTAGDEWRVFSNKLGTSITPTNFTVKQQTTRGSAAIQPLIVNESILFVDFVGRKIRELTYSDEKQKYVSPDLTALGEHITESGITSIAHQKNPDSILWCTLDDGTLISMTYEREQNVIGWARHPLGGDAEAQSVCVVPDTIEDYVWLSIGLTINSVEVTHIVRMASRTFDSIDDCFFVDDGLTVTNSPASTTISGLTHLIGETVKVLGDGVVLTPTAVVDGSGEVTVGTAVTTAQVGLSYTYKLQPMRPDVGQDTTHSSYVKVAEMGISFLNTMNAKYGVDMNNLLDIDWDNAKWTNNTEIDDLFTGDVIVSVDGGFSFDNNLIISGSDPLPCTVRALIPKLEKVGR